MSNDDAWRTALPTVVWLLMFVCAEPLVARREQTARATEGSPSQTSRSASTADHMQDFTWISSQTHTNMGSTSNRVCFLTRVAGNFGSDRYVRIYSSNGSWWLGGSEPVVSGSPNTVSASARRSFAYSYTGEYSWSQGQDATLMGSIYGRACFLTRVGGQLRGSGERVEVYSGNSTSWRLGGSSLHFGVHARARCVIYPPPPVPQQPYTYTGWVSSGAGGTVLQPTSWACYLAGIRGGFSGSNSLVTIVAREGFWYVSGKADDNPTGAKVGCTGK